MHFTSDKKFHFNEKIIFAVKKASWYRWEMKLKPKADIFATTNRMLKIKSKKVDCKIMMPVTSIPRVALYNEMVT